MDEVVDRDWKVVIENLSNIEMMFLIMSAMQRRR